MTLQSKLIWVAAKKALNLSGLFRKIVRGINESQSQRSLRSFVSRGIAASSPG